jgi:hypothetical protein
LDSPQDGQAQQEMQTFVAMNPPANLNGGGCVFDDIKLVEQKEDLEG